MNDNQNNFEVPFIIAYSIINEIIDLLIYRNYNDQSDSYEYSSRADKSILFCTQKKNSFIFNIKQQPAGLKPVIIQP